ncbi:MAG: 2-oxo acid dehydrogenase subunit E2 [Deltaproteobacteria bacterium]|nr:2-oxo acid dehydrogenase subunit E2 [Deltaproteobacteria bacterium]
MDYKIPELGENIESGDVVKVSVSVGDAVKKDQTLLELETDKAVVEVPSDRDGTVKEILIKEGDKVSVGQVAFKIEGGAASAQAPEEKAPPQKEIVQETVQEVVKEEPQKPAPQQEVPKQAEQKSEPVVAKQEAAQEIPEAPVVKSSSGKTVAASPSVRRLAREIGIDLDSITGTGPGGRIIIEDVKQHARRINTSAKAEEVAKKSNESLPDFSKWGQVERQPMTAVRRKTARHLSEAWVAPHVTQFEKADITELEKLRKNFGKRAEAAGGKLTMTVIVLKIVASALKVFPQFNASVDMSTDEIIYKKYFNIGVAVDTDRGLLVPVIRDVEKKNILQLAKELGEKAVAARDRKLSLDDMQGGTFTITNLGGIGGTAFTPIVNAPEVAILGLSRGNIEPVYKDGEFQPRLMLPLSLSYDHRLIDGADAMRFLRWIAEALQQPFLMDLEG